MVEQSLISTLPMLIGILPQILFITQIAMYLFLIWLFGSIAIRGCTLRVNFPIKLCLMLGLGFMALIAAFSLPTLPPLNEGIFKFLQLDIILNGLIGAVILAISIYLLSYKNKPLSHKVIIENLKKKVNTLEGLLSRGKVKRIEEGEAKSKAESILKGYKAVKANLNNQEWEVLLTKGKKEAKIIFDTWDCEVKKIIHKKSILDFFLPGRTAGIIIIAIFLIFSLTNFKGFPSISDSFSAMFGFTPEQLNKMLNASMSKIPELPAGCIDVVTLFSELSTKLDERFFEENKYLDLETKILIEQKTNSSVITMAKTEFNRKEVILAFTDDMKLCYLTDKEFCTCIET